MMAHKFQYELFADFASKTRANLFETSNRALAVAIAHAVENAFKFCGAGKHYSVAIAMCQWVDGIEGEGWCILNEPGDRWREPDFARGVLFPESDYAEGQGNG